MYQASDNAPGTHRDFTEPVPLLAENVASVSSFVGAFALAAGSKDAAIVVTLGPGSHTVHLRSTAGAAPAEVLGEVYLVN